MSKSRDLLIPALGGTALVLGLAYGLASRNAGADQIASLQTRVAQVSAQAAQAGEATERETARADALTVEMAGLVDAAAEAAAAPKTAALLSEPAPQRAGGYGIGRVALPQEIAAWDVDVLPDGRGLPEGRGDVLTGEELFADQCAACHGDFAEGVGNWPVLAGGFDTLADKDPVKTVGSYWPYLSTVWDYIHRSMPFGAAQTLSPDETYAIVAYILYSNDLVDEDFELSHENFTGVEMHNADGFVIDDRAQSEYPEWSAQPCMENCKTSVQITMRASVLDVTPDGGDDSAMEDHAADSEPVPVASPAPAPVAALDPALVAAGEKVFRKCKACHTVGEGARNKTGPHLNGLIGRRMGGLDGFRYSSALGDAQAAGRVWDADTLAAFLAAPRAYMPGTKMAFSGLRRPADLVAIEAYLRSFTAVQ